MTASLSKHTTHSLLMAFPLLLASDNEEFWKLPAATERVFKVKYSLLLLSLPQLLELLP